MIIDRALSYGHEGPLALDVKATLYGLERQPAIHCFVAGIGGREISAEMIAGTAADVLAGRSHPPERPQLMPWINLYPTVDAMEHPGQGGVIVEAPADRDAAPVGEES